VVTVVSERNQVSVPAWVTDLESFRHWADADDFPEMGRICFLQGEVWVDVSREQIFAHLGVKNAFSFTLTGLTVAAKSGLFIPDGLLVTNVLANLAVKPDGTFISFASLEAGRVQLVEGAEGGFVEVEGAPDMALEVVSDSSVEKDNEFLREAYWKAQIQEYWLVDARTDPLRFDIFKHGARGYVPVRKHGGWVKSAVFGKSFRLVKSQNAIGQPEFHLKVR
jgi:Uma2 family endonuclease